MILLLFHAVKKYSDYRFDPTEIFIRSSILKNNRKYIQNITFFDVCDLMLILDLHCCYRSLNSDVSRAYLSLRIRPWKSLHFHLENEVCLEITDFNFGFICIAVISYSAKCCLSMCFD